MNLSTGATTRSETTSAAASRVSIIVTAICWGMVVLEGYDLISFGSVLPVLINTPDSGYNPANAGIVASMAFVGATIGALSSGWLSDRYGRRAVAIGCLGWFSVFTMMCGFADGPFWLGLLRLLAGIGIGGIVPATSALTLEYASKKHRTLAYTLMLSGVPIGGVLAAISGLTVIPTLGWRWVFFIAIVPALIVLPFILSKLPESLTFLEHTGQFARAEALRAKLGLEPAAAAPADAHKAHDTVPATARSGGIFSRGYLAASLMFAAATFFGLLTWFGLGTWLPGIMRATGYDLGNSLVFLLVLNIGAIIGSIFIAVATDRFGNKKILVPTYMVMAIALVILTIKMPQPPLLLAMAIAGVGGHGGQILINRFVSRSYGARHRASALGWSLGAGRLGTIVGPIVIGYIVAGGKAGLGFAFFAACAVAAALLLWFTPATPAFKAEEE
ncbi:MFS transporter [Pseudarthrobacter psychrotolerans]|uniref:MFS transporter n=1 Tax=Pseudarthrobacter psychrotolerans TaxID=2697569 RepID=A0A6P1NIC1_9MICC|nr:aromatic acid/H+ symport family MFS transporter [Pseudarthrobacter psychrotolerans]QHK18557.1 MFS transporter [Pseudarthrobacter psychrotolerans]